MTQANLNIDGGVLCPTDCPEGPKRGGRAKIFDAVGTQEALGLDYTPKVNLERFRMNPVMLLYHQRENVIGRWEEIEEVGSDIYAVPVFNTEKWGADEIHQQWEDDFLISTSIGAKHEGETLEVTEVSVVDIPKIPTTIKQAQEQAQDDTEARLQNKPVQTTCYLEKDHILLSYNSSLTQIPEGMNIEKTDAQPSDKETPKPEVTASEPVSTPKAPNAQTKQVLSLIHI